MIRRPTMRRYVTVGVVGLLLVAPWLVGALAPTPTAAQGPCPGINRPLTPYAREQLAVSTTAVGFTVATYTAGGAAPVLAVAKVQTAAIMYLDDGGTPTPALGMDAHAGTTLTICTQSISRFLAIQQGATAATVMAVFYK